MHTFAPLALDARAFVGKYRRVVSANLRPRSNAIKGLVLSFHQCSAADSLGQPSEAIKLDFQVLLAFPHASPVPVYRSATNQSISSLRDFAHL